MASIRFKSVPIKPARLIALLLAAIMASTVSAQAPRPSDGSPGSASLALPAPSRPNRGPHARGPAEAAGRPRILGWLRPRRRALGLSLTSCFLHFCQSNPRISA